MAELILLRHFPTDWNTARRIQGKTDTTLSASSLSRLQQITLPPQWQTYQWFSSPLLRCRQTANALGIDDCKIADALAEMNWGEFEGLTLPEIEYQIAHRQLNPSTGLDFRPPRGETPAEVRIRLQTWLEALNATTSVAVTHKGVIRAALSLATGWDMEAPIHRINHPQLVQKIDWLRPLKFSYGHDRKLELVGINLNEWCVPDAE
ncbi:MAG: histidine phosphatase family protein [Acidiferrobacterales bacterium]|nr:histidine phosphatase family protein [Acidiferrobacterales bacterium]